MLDLSWDKLYEEPLKSELRPLLQAWGQARRNQNPDYWLHQHAKLINRDESFIVDDVRFPNEQSYLHGLKAIHAHISMSKNAATDYLEFRKSDPALADDVSESHQDELAKVADIVVEYNGVPSQMFGTLMKYILVTKELI